ncbi:MAG: flagellar hook-basal body complex protein FliE [Phycisphaerales bacterium]|nr:flagellar hook-basal body complex protein FliE [Phycisphaerales bacterium]
MVDPIQANAVSPITTNAVGGAQSAKSGGKDFMEVLMNSLDEVNRLQNDADKSVQALYTGETDDVAGVFTAVNKAGVAFDLLMEIRNKLVEAYHEIQQIRV